MSNSKNDLSKFIDEVFKPVYSAESVLLTSPVDGLLSELVEEDMRAKNLDPLNKNDVKKYWASKGVESNG